MNTNLNKIFSSINHNISIAHYHEAINELRLLKPIVDESLSKIVEIEEIKKENTILDTDITIVLNYSGFLIDSGSAINDSKIIEEGVDFANKIFIKLNHEHNLYLNIGYNIANGYGSLLQIKQHSSDQHYWVADDLTEKTKKLYRDIATKVSPTDSFILPILTNYANLLNGRLGRIIEALHVYNKVLMHNPNFAMALANKGYVQSLFAVVINGDVRGLILHEAYQNIKKAIMIGLDEGPKKYFEGILENVIKRVFPQVESLDDDIGCKSVLKDDNNFESFYKRFCISHDLYLNPLSNSHQCDAALYDPITITSMVESKNERDKFFKFSGYFNQIKQEYSFARYLAVQSFYKDTSIKFIDEGVVLIDTLDYSLYSVYLEQARTAFRILYSILDKIAFVVNEYMKIGIPEKEVYFHRLSPLYNKNIFEKFYPLKNPYIAAILDLATDFRNEHFKKISDLRNTFEHRFGTIHLNAIPRDIMASSLKAGENDMMTTIEFKNLLLELLPVVKSAIFYLALMIEWEERLKVQNIGKEKIFKLYAKNIDDDLKADLNSLI